MSIKKRYGEKSGYSALRYLYYFLFGLVLIWLLASMFFKNNPIDLVKNVFTKIDAPSEVPIDSLSSIDPEVAERDSIIAGLENELAICRGEKNYQQALVKINSSNLNMRDQASLNSDVVLQIPAGSVVDVMYYDKQTYFLEGKKGNWAHVRYAGKEGWVWGNYLENLEEEDPALDTIPAPEQE